MDAALQGAEWASALGRLKHRPIRGDRVVLKGSLTSAVTPCERAGDAPLSGAEVHPRRPESGLVVRSASQISGDHPGGHLQLVSPLEADLQIQG